MTENNTYETQSDDIQIDFQERTTALTLRAVHSVRRDGLDVTVSHVTRISDHQEPVMFVLETMTWPVTVDPV